MGNLEPLESGRLRNNRPEVFSVYNFIKKETGRDCKFGEIPRNTFFTKHLWPTASVLTKVSNFNLKKTSVKRK